MGSTRSKTMNKGLKSKSEVAKILKIDSKEMMELEEEGLFEFADKAKQVIDEKNIDRIRVAAALKKELGVNVAGIEIILNMREKMKQMRLDMNAFLQQVRGKLEGKLADNVQKIKKEIE